MPDGFDISSAGSGALGGAAAGATVGGPIGALVGAVAGFGLSVIGGIDKYQAAQQQSAAQQKITGFEIQQDAVRRKTMEISARRMSLEAIRNGQKAQAQAETSAVNQGAQFGSGISGGLSQISGYTNTNLLGISQGLQSGEKMFDLNNQINEQKIALAKAGGLAATGSALSGAGSSLLGSLPAIKSLSSGFFPGGGSGGGGGTLSDASQFGNQRFIY